MTSPQLDCDAEDGVAKGGGKPYGLQRHGSFRNLHAYMYEGLDSESDQAQYAQ